MVIFGPIWADSACFVRAIARNIRCGVYCQIPIRADARLADAHQAGAMARSHAEPAADRQEKRTLLDVSKAASVGGRIRDLRTAKGLTLDRLASLSELTRGYISLVERGLKVPSLAALLRMAKALDVNVASFFDSHPPHTPRYTLVRQSERRGIEEEGFAVVALATGRTRKMMEPFLLRPPLKPAPRASHAGEEMLFVVSGKVGIKLDGDDLILSKGDCLYFSGETPHEVRSLGRQKAEVLVVVAQVLAG
jgi:transcriptional regulator with XRE-family HTH domain